MSRYYMTVKPAAKFHEASRQLTAAQFSNMARGWESKSVEAQQDEAARTSPRTRPLSEAQRLLQDRRYTLTLTRSRAVADLGRATAPQHRKMLEAAIAALDDQLAHLTE